jgi:CRP-like cAMP-binding protein
MDSKLQNLKKILEKPQESRDAIDLKLIASYISKVKFFESLKDQRLIFKECCTYIKYEFVQGNSYVFKAGDVGDKFYILLKGEAGVIITIKENNSFIPKEVLVYRDGGSFGELALTENKPRAASIFAKVDCHFAILDKLNYNRILSSILIKKRNDLIEFLQSQAMFKNLTKGSLLKLSYCFEEKSLKKDQVLFRECEKNDFLFLIREGEIKLSQNLKIQMIDSSEPVTKATICLKKFVVKKVDIGILGVGEMIGLSDLDKSAYSASCICFSPNAKVLAISLFDFKRRINNQDSLKVITDGTKLRKLIHDDSIKSATKIIKDRVQSPYKRILLSETLTPGSVEELKMQNYLKFTSISPKKDSEDSDASENTTPYCSFDLRNQSKPARRMFEEIKIKGPFQFKSARPMSSKHSTLDSVSQKITRLRKNQIRLSKNSDTCKNSISYASRDEKNNLSLNSSNMESLIKKIKPFGRNRITYSNIKEKEVVNFHTSSKKNLNVRPNTPKNWSFRIESKGSRRPVSNYVRNKIT